MKTLTLALALMLAVPAFAGHFKDVEEGCWYSPYVEASYDFGLFAGYPDGTFRPDNPITRAETATVLTRLFDLPVENCTVSPYPDVPVDAWFCPFVKAVKEAGISDTQEGEDFRPNDNAMRYEVIVMLENGLGAELSPCTSSPFTDVLPGDDFCPAVAAAKEQGVTAGYPDGTFRPFSTITRAEIAAMMDRVHLKRHLPEGAVRYLPAALAGAGEVYLAVGAVVWWKETYYPNNDIFACDNYGGNTHYGTEWVQRKGSGNYTVRELHCTIYGFFTDMTGVLDCSVADGYRRMECTAVSDFSFKSADGKYEFTVKAGSRVDFYAPDYDASSGEPAVMNIGGTLQMGISGAVKVKTHEGEGSYRFEEAAGAMTQVYHYSFTGMDFAGNVTIAGQSHSFSTDNATFRYFDSNNHNTLYEEPVFSGTVVIDGVPFEIE